MDSCFVNIKINNVTLSMMIEHHDIMTLRLCICYTYVMLLKLRACAFYDDVSV